MADFFFAFNQGKRLQRKLVKICLKILAIFTISATINYLYDETANLNC